MGILIAIWYITPPGMHPRDIYLPFGIMLGLTALYALVWTVFVQKVNPFRAVAIEDILAEEFGKVGGHASLIDEELKRVASGA